MNMQNIMVQAKKMQKEMEKAQSELESKNYEGKSQLVTAVVDGKPKVVSVSINMDEVSSDDKELIEDMVIVAINDALSKMEKDKEAKFGKYSQILNGIM